MDSPLSRVSEETLLAILAALHPDQPLGKLASTFAELAALGLESAKAGGSPGSAAGDSPKLDPWLTPSEVCDYLKISLDTLTKYRSRYAMKSAGQNRARRYRLSEVERVMTEIEGGER